MLESRLVSIQLVAKCFWKLFSLAKIYAVLPLFPFFPFFIILSAIPTMATQVGVGSGNNQHSRSSQFFDGLLSLNIARIAGGFAGG